MPYAETTDLVRKCRVTMTQIVLHKLCIYTSMTRLKQDKQDTLTTAKGKTNKLSRQIMSLNWIKGREIQILLREGKIFSTKAKTITRQTFMCIQWHVFSY